MPARLDRFIYSIPAWIHHFSDGEASLGSMNQGYDCWNGHNFGCAWENRSGLVKPLQTFNKQVLVYLLKLKSLIYTYILSPINYLWGFIQGLGH